MSGWSQWAWSDSLANSGLVMSAQALGLWMAQRADFDTGRFTGFAMTRRVIVDATGWHSGTIDKAIRELKKAGFLDGNSGEWRLLEQTLNSPHRQMSPPGETSHRQMSPPRER